MRKIMIVLDYYSPALWIAGLFWSKYRFYPYRPDRLSAFFMKSKSVMIGTLGNEMSEVNCHF